MDHVRVWPHQTANSYLHLYRPSMMSLPSNDDFKSLLTSCSTRFTNRYLVTKIIQCPPDPEQPDSNITTPLYSVAKPLVWHRNESASSVAGERSGDESGAETEDDQGDEPGDETEDDQSDEG